MSERERGGRDGFSVSISDRERGASVTSQSVRPMYVCMYVCMGYRSVGLWPQTDGWMEGETSLQGQAALVHAGFMRPFSHHSYSRGGREGGRVGRPVRACVGRTSVVAVGWAGKEPTHPPGIRPWSHDGR